MESDSKLVIGLILGLLMGIIGNIWVEIFFKWWYKFYPNNNGNIGTQLVTMTIILFGFGCCLYLIARELKSTE